MHEAFTSVPLMLHSADSYQFKMHGLVKFIVSCRSAFSINTVDVPSHGEEAYSMSKMWMCEVF